MEGPSLRSTILRAIAITLVLGVAVALSFVLVQGQMIMLALFGAIVIGEAVRPIVDRLSSSIPRVAAIIVAFGIVFAALAAIWLLPIRALMPQLITLWNDLPVYAAQLASQLTEFSQRDSAHAAVVTNLEAGARASLGSLAEGFFRVQSGIGSALGTLGLTFVMAGFWLGSSATLATFVLSVVPPAQRENVSALGNEIGAKLGLYVTGTVVNGMMVAVECTALLALLRTPYPLIFGLLQGLLIAIPYLGTLIGVLVVGGVVLATQGWISAAAAVAAVSLAQMIQGTFIAPLIFKKGLDIDPLLTVLATALGGALFGVFGVVLAVPAASVIQTVVARVIAPAIRAGYGDER